MKKLLQLISIILLASVSSLNAQNVIRCATDEYNAAQVAADPSISIERELIRQQVENFIQQNAGQAKNLVVIPVVFHVLYANAAQNIPDAKIIAQMEQLNLDYMAINPDTSNIPAAFKPHKGNVQVQFCFAQRTPTGAATNGIIRKSTTVTSWSQNDAIKFSAQMGDDIWNRNQYLNIWVGNISGGILGYAQFPGGSASTDGVVVHYGTVGSKNSPSTFNWGANYNWGRSATHEIGHWLGMFHTFQGGCPNTNCNSQGDQICDTPPISTANFGCPGYPHVTCSNGPNGDMFMNYMDYVDDNCMVMFSDSQSIKMNAVLNGTRSSLKTSPGCTPVGIFYPEANIMASVYPNPSTDFLNVSITRKEVSDVEISLINVIGTVLYRESFNNRREIILKKDMKLIPDGFYFLNIKTPEGTLSKKITVLH